MPEQHTLLDFRNDIWPERALVKFVIAPLLSALAYLHEGGRVFMHLRPGRRGSCMQAARPAPAFETRRQDLVSRPAEALLFTSDPQPVLKLSSFVTLVSCLDRAHLAAYRCPELLDLLDMTEPELAVATGYSDAWDTWSVGCLAYELLGGRSPFARLGYEETKAAVRENKPPLFPSGVSPEASAVILGALVRPSGAGQPRPSRTISSCSGSGPASPSHPPSLPCAPRTPSLARVRTQAVDDSALNPPCTLSTCLQKTEPLRRPTAQDLLAHPWVVGSSPVAAPDVKFPGKSAESNGSRSTAA